MVAGLVASVKSQILSHWSLTASGVMGLPFSLTIWPSERSHRTAHMDTQIKRSLHGATSNAHFYWWTRVGRISQRQLLRKYVRYSHLPTQPAPTWIQIWEDESTYRWIHSCRGKRHAAAHCRMVACILSLYLKKSSVFLALFMTQPEDQGGDILRLQRHQQVWIKCRENCYFYNREQCICMQKFSHLLLSNSARMIRCATAHKTPRAFCTGICYTAYRDITLKP